ncbi:MAG TPA: twin-arginine translocase TatA/TatE family subunit [Kaistia sp.]|jgi:sec-independent protein translocase protein TatA|nr:twin-arginine translocase TatA/TatE family subunit [Kaistia sp.]
MGSFSIWHWLIVLVIVLLLFGKGKISDVMGDMAKGVKSFKKGLADDDEPTTTTKPVIDNKPSDVVSSNTDEKTRAS